jgi:hypothetical protein
MRKVEIRCPNCNKRGFIELTFEKFPNVTKGLLAVNIAPNTICSHSFIAYVDKNYNVRDYFTADFQLDLPEIPIIKKDFQPDTIPAKQIFDIDLIKLNLPAILITNVLNAIFNNKKVLIISNQTFLHNHILNFFRYITHDSFQITIAILTEEDYKRSKNNYNDFIVFEEFEIVKNKKFIDLKKLKIEKQLVNRFLIEPDLGYSYIVLKNDIQKAFELSKEIITLIGDYKGTEKIGKKEVMSMIAENNGTKITIPYLDFLLDIVKNYFKTDLSRLSDYIFPALGI